MRGVNRQPTQSSDRRGDTDYGVGYPEPTHRSYYNDEMREEVDRAMHFGELLEQLAFESADYQMCCGGPRAECHCESSLAFSTVDETLLSNGIRAYAQNGGCESCVFAYSPRCTPYLSLLDRYVQSPLYQEDIEQLTRCDLYRSYNLP